MEWYEAGDTSAHGTHVFGTIGADDSNDEGIPISMIPTDAGICYVIVRVFGSDDNFGTYTSNIIDGLNWAVAQGAKVINLSLGGPGFVAGEEAAYVNAYNAGALAIASAGNTYETTYQYPASFNTVVSVGATDQNE